MLEILAGLALLQAPTTIPADMSPAYADDSLSGFVAIENGRAIDGIDYSDGEGLFSAGLIYAHPGGFFAGTEFLAGSGGINLPPGEDIRSLQAFAGYAWTAGPHRFAVELLDYRFEAGSSIHDYQGIGLRYRRGGFEAEIARERDRPYYYRYQYRDRFIPYDNDRVAIGWQQEFDDDLVWSLGAGARRIGETDVQYRFITAALHGQVAGVDWRVGFSRASDDLDSFYGGRIDRNQWLARIAIPFRIF